MGITTSVNSSEFKNTGLLILFSLVTRLGYFFVRLSSGEGLPEAYDTEWYLEHARRILTDFKISLDFNGVFYLGYYTLLSMLLLIFKSQTAIIFIQMVINAVSVVLVYRIAFLLFKNRRVAFISGLFYTFTMPLIYWSFFILTDSFFVTLILLNVYLLLKFYETKSRKYLLLFITTSLYILVFRPTGISTLAFIALYIIINLDFSKIMRIYRLWVISGLIAIVLVISFVLLKGYLTPLFGSLSRNLEELIWYHYVPGHIFDASERFAYKYTANFSINHFNSFPVSFFINNWNHILVLYLFRAFLFWAPIVTTPFSLDKLYIVFAFLFGAIGFIYLIRRTDLRKTSIILFVIFSIWFFCIIFFMDSSFRYRVPALVFLNFIAALGVDNFLNWSFKGLNNTRRRF